MPNFMFIFNFIEACNGLFARKRTVHKDLQPLYDMIKSRTYVGSWNDKANLNTDYNRFKKDFKKSLREYHTTHGETK
ncbi:hypothetical protein GVN22_27510 [Cellulophaga sp. BC115SP]|nr:hypothetical protein [Cellulophaga sp. BC115SP]